ncbi:MAG: peptidase [Deltaproteobacteria bacterium]|nr:MAG: peptidase [Deltaproteobacteria bacterium]
MKHNRQTSLSVRVSLAVIGILAVFLTPILAQAAFPGLGNKTPTSFADLADSVKHSVVNISTTQVIKGSPLRPFGGPNSPFGHFFGDDFFKHFFGNIPQEEMKTHALGSGFVISSDGFIVTNNHVVKKATEIKVKLDSGKEYDAKIVGRDPKTDLALIKVMPDKNFPEPVKLGNSDVIRVGDWVMAVGNPFGLGQTVTTGIISAKGRIIGAGPYDDFLQTDAAINPGNSGGPLFNMKGEVVGINTAIIARGQNIGFAIPINMAKELLPQLKSGKIIRGWLGVMIQDITSELAKSFGLSTTKGVLVSDVTKGSPADKAGLERGDVIKRFNGKEVKDSHMLSRTVAATRPKTKVTIDIVRDGKEKSLQVLIGTMPKSQEAVSPENANAWGLTVQEMSPDLARHLNLNPDEEGVVISGVKPGSPAAEAGLRPGDIIKEVDRKEIKDLDDYQRAMQKATKSGSVLFLIKRGDGTLFVVLKQSEK